MKTLVLLAAPLLAVGALGRAARASHASDALVQSPSSAAATKPRTWPEERQVHWQRSLEDALALCAASGRPLLIAVNTDAESASERIVREVYRDPEFVAATRSLVCVLASPLRHTPRDHDARGVRAIDPRFGEITSGEATRLEPQVFERFLGGERIAPRHALILPAGEKGFDLFQLFDFRDLVNAVRGAAERAGPAIELEPGVPEALARDPAERAKQWRALAGARSARHRARFEALLAGAPAASLDDALQAIEEVGNAGSLEALRVLLARAPVEGESFRARLVRCARTLQLGGPLAFALWEQLLALDARAGQPGVSASANLLPMLGELARDLEATPPGGEIADPGLSAKALRSYLLAARALGAAGAGLEQECAAAALVADQGSAAASNVARALDAAGGPFDAAAAWRGVARAEAGALQPDVTLPLGNADELADELEALEGARSEDAAWWTKRAHASLELARVRMASGATGADLLLEDALTAFERARAARPADLALVHGNARAAYEAGRFELEERCALEAVALARPDLEQPAPWRPLAERLARDADEMETLRWCGDASARLLAARFGGPCEVEAVGMLRGGRALCLAAASAGARPTDWVSVASFFGALGRRREEFSWVREGLRRAPESQELHAALERVTSSMGVPDAWLDVCSELARAHPASAAVLWYHGFASSALAEWARNGEDPQRALELYAAADEHYARSAELEPSYEDGARFQRARAALGRGFAALLIDDRERAADELVHGIELAPQVARVRDGLDREALDLLDNVLEWRAGGPSPVDPAQLAGRLATADANVTPWWRAVSDSELREALRAIGRSAPNAEVDAFLEQSIRCGRVALTEAERVGTASADDRHALAQALTVRAERALAGAPASEEELDRAARDLTEAAGVLDGTDASAFAAPAAADDGALRSLAAALRERLGEARPVLRPGR